MTEENDYGGHQKLIHQGSGTIPALADEELLGEDDDYDDLYSDVSVGESFFQAHHQTKTPAQVGGTGSGSIKAQNSDIAQPRMPIVSGGTVGGKYGNDSAAAAGCKEGMNGYIFNDKACVVAFASPETLKQMGANFTGRNQGQNQVQNRSL